VKVRLKNESRPEAISLANKSVAPWLHAGKVYDVLSVEGRGKYRIESEQSGTPALFDSAIFEVVDGSRPSNWVAYGENLLPERWAARGFWEAFFDGEPEALRIYREERQLIK
jgi:hypothetical protein